MYPSVHRSYAPQLLYWQAAAVEPDVRAAAAAEAEASSSAEPGPDTLATLSEADSVAAIVARLAAVLGIDGRGRPKEFLRLACAHLGEPCPAGKPKFALLALACKAEEAQARSKRKGASASIVRTRAAAEEEAQANLAAEEVAAPWLKAEELESLGVVAAAEKEEVESKARAAAAAEAEAEPAEAAEAKTKDTALAAPVSEPELEPQLELEQGLANQLRERFQLAGRLPQITGGASSRYAEHIAEHQRRCQLELQPDAATRAMLAAHLMAHAARVEAAPRADPPARMLAGQIRERFQLAGRLPQITGGASSRYGEHIAVAAGAAEVAPDPGVPGGRQATELLDQPLQRDVHSEFVAVRRQLEHDVQQSGDDHAVLLLASPVSPEEAEEARVGLGRIVALHHLLIHFIPESPT